jgi:hypothetical protein
MAAPKRRPRSPSLTRGRPTGSDGISKTILPLQDLGCRDRSDEVTLRRSSHRGDPGMRARIPQNK